MMDFMTKSNGYLDQFLSDRYNATKTKMAENGGGMKAKAAEMAQVAAGAPEDMMAPISRAGSNRPMNPGEAEAMQRRSNTANGKGGKDYGQERATAARKSNKGKSYGYGQGEGMGKLKAKMQSSMTQNPRENIKRQLGAGGIGEMSAYQGFMG